ncbi:hypothetical protein ACKFKG_29330 [Phormidesmis sp. 146-35]
MVKPWRGRHQVYGIFVLPPGYNATEFFQISLKDAGSYCGTVSGLDDFIIDTAIAPDELLVEEWKNDRLVVGRLRTRTALWVMSKGKQDLLNLPQNWSLQLEKGI